jgi:cytidylate kinase
MAIMAAHPVIALDGTAASGKSTIAQAVARRLGFIYVNTGAMYRGVTWLLLERGVPLTDAEAITRMTADLRIETRLEGSELVFTLDGIDTLSHVRGAKVTAGVSAVSAVAEVRRRLVAEQQKLSAHASLVMEGRDIGTAVFPQTPYKFYLDADASVRAERRSRQGETDAIHRRDAIDSQRVISPLVCAPDAVRLDSGHSTVKDLVAAIVQHLAEKGLPEAKAAR